jgi:hypothetical protein
LTIWPAVVEINASVAACASCDALANPAAVSYPPNCLAIDFLFAKTEGKSDSTLVPGNDVLICSLMFISI